MKKTTFYTIAALALLMCTYGCSTKKNTWQTRTYQEVNTRFNVFFNGEISYKEGLENINKAHQENYSDIIHMYPISQHKNADAGKANMERTIEKCRKAIKLHSIKLKPERNQRKWRNPDYQLWYNQEEFNPALKYAWLLLGKAEFHKGDFLGAAGTFTYIMHHYANDKDAVAQCQLWIVRAYAEMDWLYEAEQKLGQVKQEDLNWRNTELFSSVSADLLLKKKQYKEAIPFLEIALKQEKNKTNRIRFTYLLAQLYQRTGNKTAALSTFNKVIDMSPSFGMELNARIQLASLDPNAAKVRKSLQKMLKDSKNKDYFDQIYFATGNTYLNAKDTTQAIGFYNKSIKASTRNGLDNAVTLVTLGDIYYEKQQYIKAQPCYNQAAKIFPTDYSGYARISKRSESLGELVAQYEIVHLQDSLQALAKLTDGQRAEVIKKVIDKVIADEKAAQEAATEAANRNNMNPDEDFIGPPIGAPVNSGNWYFYNEDLMRTGKSEFRKKWGTRKLEDNWRRVSKASSLFAEETQTQTAGNNATATQESKTNEANNTVSDNKKQEFYLQQIPMTPAQVQKSDNDIATALFAMAVIYKERIEDDKLASETYEAYLKRFPGKEMAAEACFQLYILNIKTQHKDIAEAFRQRLVKDYPDSKYAQTLSNPDYIQQQQKMYVEQDSLYRAAYTAFNQSNFEEVKRLAAYIEKQHPASELLPKFMFIKALSIGKTDKKEVFEKELEQLVSRFPDSDVSSTSKDILALLKQGMENKNGTTQGTLLAKREESIPKADAETVTQLKFSTDKTGRHRAMFVAQTDAKSLNELLYNVAVYNFSRIIMKDYDLVTATLDSTRVSLSVTGFDTYDEAAGYLKNIQTDKNINQLILKLNVTPIVISEENYGIARSGLGMDQYLMFINGQQQNAVKVANAGLPVNGSNAANATKQTKTN